MYRHVLTWPSEATWFFFKHYPIFSDSNMFIETYNKLTCMFISL